MMNILHTNYRGLAASILLPALVWACGKTSIIESPSELSLRPSASVPTKSDPELSGASLGTDNTYVILASASTSENPGFFDGVLYTYYSDVAKWRATQASGTGISGPYTVSPRFWPFGGAAVDFLALALKPQAYDALTASPASIVWNDNAHGGAAAGVTVKDWDTYEHQYDVMYAVKNTQTSGSHPGGYVPLEFSHSMAVIGFTARMVPGSDASVYTLKKLTFKGLSYKGTLRVDNSVAEYSADWSGLTSGDKSLFNNYSGTDTNLDFVVPGSDASDNAAQCAQHLLVIPQISRNVTLTYHVRNTVPDLDKEIPLPRVVWKAGHRYIYNLAFSQYEIIVEGVTVTDWNGTPIDESGLIDA